MAIQRMATVTVIRRTATVIRRTATVTVIQRTVTVIRRTVTPPRLLTMRRDVTMHADTTTATKPADQDPPVLSGGIMPAKETPAEEMPRRGLVAGGSLEEPSADS